MGRFKKLRVRDIGIPLYITTSRRFKCVPQILGLSSIHIFRLLFLPLSITFRRIHERNSFDLGAICLFCFEFCCLIDFFDLPVKFAAVCGNAYKSFKRGGQLWLHNIFSVTHRITKETSLINLKLIKAYKYLVSNSIFLLSTLLP